jgi:hypothetical protein
VFFFKQINECLASIAGKNNGSDQLQSKSETGVTLTMWHASKKALITV